MARVINGTLFVPSFTTTGTPGEWTFTGATYTNVTDATGNGAFDITTGFVLYVPASDPNTFLPVSGGCHRYLLTSVSIIDSSTIDGTMLWDEGGAEIDTPTNGDTSIISEKGPGLGLGFPVSQQVYSSLGAGIDYAAYAADARAILDGITTGGGSDKEYNEVYTALVTTSDGDFAIASGLTRNPAGAVIVTVNGVQVTIGDGTSSNCDAYFTDPSNATPRTHDAITTGDKIRWVGSFAGYELATSDRIQITYEA
jgi:hypothetical protein